MSIIIAILTICIIVVLIILVCKLESKLNKLDPKSVIYSGLTLLFIVLTFISSFILGISGCKSETNTIKDYNKGLYQEIIKYESIDGNMITTDTLYIFDYKKIK